MDDLSPVIDSYSSNAGQEQTRLERDAYHSLEFLVTMHYLRKHLPPSGVILDAGGGTGPYAIELCRMGYQVVLLDPVRELLDIAAECFAKEPAEVRTRLLESVVGDVRDLPRFPDRRFDAVVSLGGPISHLPVEGDRKKAVSEMARVTRSGGVVFISAMGYLDVLRTVMTKFSDELLNERRTEIFLRSGNTTSRGMEWHFFRAAELRELAESCGLGTLDMAGLEGLSSGLPDATNVLHQDKAKWDVWLKIVLDTASEPAVVDMAGHILYVGRAALQCASGTASCHEPSGS